MARDTFVSRHSASSWAMHASPEVTAMDVCREGPSGRGTGLKAVPSLVEDLHTECLLILILMVIDVDQDLLLPGAVTWQKPQADGVGLSSRHLREHRRVSTSSRLPLF